MKAKRKRGRPPHDDVLTRLGVPNRKALRGWFDAAVSGFCCHKPPPRYNRSR